jgi:hypothetical protein
VRRFVVELATGLDDCVGQEAVENALQIIAGNPPVDDLAGVCRTWGRALLAFADGANDRRSVPTPVPAATGVDAKWVDGATAD